MHLLPAGGGHALPEQLEATADANLLAQLLQLGPQRGQREVFASGHCLLDVNQIALQSTHKIGGILPAPCATGQPELLIAEGHLLTCRLMCPYRAHLLHERRW